MDFQDIKKKVLGVFLLMAIFVAGFFAGNTVKYFVDQWKAKRNVALWMDSLSAPLKNDKFGGKTPEETFDMYLAALKKGDLELASKYYWITRQEKELEYLREMKENNELEAYISELSSINKDSWRRDISEGGVTIKYDGYRDSSRTIEVFDKNWKIIKTKTVLGEFSATMTFKKLENNIWKIYSL
jgi:hypothetical protein